MDRFSKACLLICVLLLGGIAFRPILTPPPAHAANQYKYQVVLGSEIGKDIDKAANDGWEFVSSIIIEQHANQPLLVFRKER